MHHHVLAVAAVAAVRFQNEHARKGRRYILGESHKTHQASHHDSCSWVLHETDDYDDDGVAQHDKVETDQSDNAMELNHARRDLNQHGRYDRHRQVLEEGQSNESDEDGREATQDARDARLGTGLDIQGRTSKRRSGGKTSRETTSDVCETHSHALATLVHGRARDAVSNLAGNEGLEDGNKTDRETTREQGGRIIPKRASGCGATRYGNTAIGAVR